MRVGTNKENGPSKYEVASGKYSLGDTAEHPMIRSTASQGKIITPTQSISNNKIEKLFQSICDHLQ